MKRIIFPIACCTILLYSCNSSTDSSVKSATTEASAVIPVEKAVPVDPKMRSQALGILDHRIKNDNQTYAVIEAGILNYDFIHDGRKISKPDDYKGDWIDFKADFTYDYGSYDTTHGQGRYHYRTDINQLVMVDNDKNQNPQEWTVKIGGDVLVLVGTSTYKNNAYQMKLSRSDAKPVKPVK